MALGMLWYAAVAIVAFHRKSQDLASCFLRYQSRWLLLASKSIIDPYGSISHDHSASVSPTCATSNHIQSPLLLPLDDGYQRQPSLVFISHAHKPNSSMDSFLYAAITVDVFIQARRPVVSRSSSFRTRTSNAPNVGVGAPIPLTIATS